LYEPLDHCQNTLSVLMQSTTPLFWSKYSPNTFRRHVLVCMNVVMASSSTASTEYALNISLRLHPLLCCTRAMMMDSLTSPFRPPRPDGCTILVNPYGLN
jgi:hypothetical protein